MQSITNYISESIYGNLGITDGIKADWVTRYNNQIFGGSSVGRDWNCRAQITDDGSIAFINGIIITDKELLTDGMLPPAFNFLVGKKLHYLIIDCKEFKSFKGLLDNADGVVITNMDLYENSIDDKNWADVTKIVNLKIYDLPGPAFMKSLLSKTRNISCLGFFINQENNAKAILPYIAKHNFLHCRQVSLEGTEAKKINPNDFINAILKNTKLFDYLQLVLTSSPMAKFEPLNTTVKGSLYLYVTPESKIDTPEKAVEFVDGINDNFNNALTSITIKSPFGMTTSLTNTMEKHIRSKFTCSPVITLQR